MIQLRLFLPDWHWGLGGAIGQNTKTSVSGLTQPTCSDKAACLRLNPVFFVCVCSGITTPGSSRSLPGPKDVSVIFMKLLRPFGECVRNSARTVQERCKKELAFCCNLGIFIVGAVAKLSALLLCFSKHAPGKHAEENAREKKTGQQQRPNC